MGSCAFVPVLTLRFYKDTYILFESTIDKVDATMADIQEQTQLANEVSEAISTQTYAGVEIDEVRFDVYFIFNSLTLF